MMGRAPAICDIKILQSRRMDQFDNICLWHYRRGTTMSIFALPPPPPRRPIESIEIKL